VDVGGGGFFSYGLKYGRIHANVGFHYGWCYYAFEPGGRALAPTLRARPAGSRISQFCVTGSAVEDRCHRILRGSPAGGAIDRYTGLRFMLGYSY